MMRAKPQNLRLRFICRGRGSWMVGCRSGILMILLQLHLKISSEIEAARNELCIGGAFAQS